MATIKGNNRAQTVTKLQLCAPISTTTDSSNHWDWQSKAKLVVAFVIMLVTEEFSSYYKLLKWTHPCL